MKTTIKSFLVAAVAATTLFSCSNEIESFEDVVPGNPGDVQISIGLGGGGATTYATEAVELAIKNGSAVLYKADGSAVIPMVSPLVTPSDDAGKGARFTATVSAEEVLKNPKAILCIYVNGTINPTAPATLAAMKAATIAQDLNLTLTNGIPASFESLELSLVGGNTISTAMRLNRVASRIGAVTTGESINGYKVTLTNVRTASGKLFPGNTAGTAGDAIVTDISLTGVTTGMYGGSEAVGYVYPSINSSITVTPATGKGEPKTVNFAPIAGKNYTIKITPKLNEDGSFNNSIEIVAWDENIDIPVDMNPIKELAKVVIQGGVAPNFKGYQDGVSVNAGYVGNNVNVEELVELPAGTRGVKIIEIATTLAADAPTQANPLSIRVQGEANVFDIATFATPSAEVKKTLKITYDNDKVQYLNIYLEKFKTNVEKLLVNIGGNLWMPFNTSGSAVDDEALAGEILRTTGADNTAKIVNYGYANFDQQRKLIGKFFFGRNIATACPAGYTAATMADWNALAGNSTLPTGTTRWCDALLTEHNTVQQFANSTLSRVAKTDISGVAVQDRHKRNFYYTFTAKAPLNATVGAILPFIGNGWAYGEGMPTPEALGGTIQWIGGPRIDGKYPRIPVWSNGINYNTGDDGSQVGNVRCVKIK